MHGALSIPDILFEIAVQLQDNNHALNAFARTCKLFEEPGLDALWREQDTILNLLGCFPPDLFKADQEGLVMKVLRPIRPDDFLRVDYYAHRVRRFVYTKVAKTVDPEHALLVLHSYDRGYLFPSLRALEWRRHGRDTYYPIELFLAPSVSSLSFYGVDIRWLPRIPRVIRHPEAITRLCIYMLLDLEEPSMISEIVRALPNLRSLEVPVLGAAELYALSQNPNLEELLLESVHVGLPSFPPNAFCGLRRLYLEGMAVNHVQAICAAWNLSNVQLLQITTCDTFYEEECEKIVDALLERCNPTQLTELWLTTKHPGSLSYWVSDNAYSATFQKVSAFSKLTLLCIVAPNGFQVVDADIAVLANALPALSFLYLTGNGTSTGLDPLLTLLSLQHLAEHCPLLEGLEIDFDARTVPGPSASARRIEQRVMDVLWVGESPLDEPAAVARFISGVFPKTAIAGNRDDEDEMSEEWERVDELLAHFVAAREEERRWAQAAVTSFSKK
ncbi:hypothetical protein MKEN_00009600 [Mycena kentingensis (nom. inval.)]|nr:hypothetical protein MKEN_00009600 [Mycena kentingensis (nom. inval.)]